MDLREQEIYARWIDKVGADKRHPSYKETVEIANFWTAIVTGKGLSELKITLREKETTAQKKRRKEVTNSTTRYVTEKIKTTYREVDRCDSIKGGIDHKEPEKKAKIEEREANFFGSESVDKFNDVFLLQYAAMDPNAFNLVNAKDRNEATEAPFSYPSIVASKDVRDLNVKYNELEFLAYQDKHKGVIIEHLWTTQHVYELIPASAGKPEEDSQLIQIASGGSIQAYLWDYEAGEGAKKIDISLPEGELPKTSFYVTRYEHKLGFVPAKRMGWLKSFEHKHDVLESFLLPAKERYKELYQKKSDYDVMLAVHGITKQVSFIPSCNYKSEHHQICNSGKINVPEKGLQDCPKCSGTGLMPVHKSPLDVITIEIPMINGKTELIDAGKMHQYFTIPQHVIEMHRDACDVASQDVALALFNTNVFKRSELTAATATEVLQNNKSVDNALYAYGSHRGAMKEFQLKCIAAYAEYSEGFSVSIRYPSDYKLETEDELYVRRKLALDAGVAPQFLHTIDMAILTKQNADNPDKIRYVEAVNSLRPFGSQTEAERIALLNLLPSGHPKKLALMYFDDVIFELDSKAESKPWYTQKAAKQKKLFYEVLKGIITYYDDIELQIGEAKGVETIPFEEVTEGDDE